MTESPASTLGPKTRERGTIGILMFCPALITGLVLRGDPANALHVAAQTNAWILLGLTIGALGIPVAVQAWKG